MTFIRFKFGFNAVFHRDNHIQVINFFLQPKGEIYTNKMDPAIKGNGF